MWDRFGELDSYQDINESVSYTHLGQTDTDLLIRKAWRRVTESGSIDYTTIREEGGCENLAGYLVKQVSEEIEGQLELFEMKEQKKLLSVSSSRNLIRPVPVRKKYAHWTMRRILKEGPKPTPGYYIDCLLYTSPASEDPGQIMLL